MSNEEQKQDLSRQVINKIVNDAAFREQLSTDPQGALKNAGFWESYTALYSNSDAEVSGYLASPGSDYCCITGIY
jgi:hypothetical protein